jgi:hypothetical protein
MLLERRLRVRIQKLPIGRAWRVLSSRLKVRNCLFYVHIIYLVKALYIAHNQLLVGFIMSQSFLSHTFVSITAFALTKALNKNLEFPCSTSLRSRIFQYTNRPSIVSAIQTERQLPRLCCPSRLGNPKTANRSLRSTPSSPSTCAVSPAYPCASPFPIR